MADDNGLFHAERCNQPFDIGAHMPDRVGLDGERLVAAAIAAHVWRSNPVPGVRQRRNLMTPRIPTLGKAVDQYDQGPLSSQLHTEAVPLVSIICRSGAI